MGDAARMATLCRRVIGGLTTANRVVSLLAGLLFLATVVLIVVDIALRTMGMRSTGGAEEISGYVMAIASTWGLSYALMERAHVRIELLQGRLPVTAQSALDVLSVASVAVIAMIVSYYCWDVLASTLAQNARANSSLQTPLWIPQSLWFAAWIWLALTSLGLFGAVAGLALAGRTDAVRAATRSEEET